MPTHFNFSFGVGSLFSFTFKYGQDRKVKKVVNPRRCLVDMRGEKEKEVANRWGIILEDPEKPFKPKEQTECPLFTTLPTEIRYIIYRYLLTTRELIDKPHKHIGSKDTAMLTNYKPIPNVDAAILRTCRAVYSEALPILCNQNVFQFSNARAISNFQNKGLVGYPFDGHHTKVFNFTVTPVGRLAMIRSVVLDLNAEYPGYFRVAHGQQRQPDRDNMWRDWSTIFFNEKSDHVYTYCAVGGTREEARFPALERCTLNFTEWQLTEEEGLLVKPFVKKLGESGGLQELVLKGVKHPATIENFRTGLVREGGTFKVVN